MPNKRPANDVIELGNSWKSDGDSNPGLVDNSITTGFTMIISNFSCLFMSIVHVLLIVMSKFSIITPVWT